jgi:beta-galactosidase
MARLDLSHRTVSFVFLIALAIAATSAASAQNSNLIEVDARTAQMLPAPSSYLGGTSVSPSHHVIALNSVYLTMDGKPWLPVMGEFHFSRVPQAEWEEEILKMKAAGVQIVAAYIIWIHHEEVEGQLEWSDQKDLRHFVELCNKHGLYVIARVGPWAHGEARNGGFPDWLLAKGPTRKNDPVYMSFVAKWYAQIGAQLKGLLWKDGGPVIGIQIENEYSGRGPGEGEEYILALKRLALESGLDVPLYTVTGWDNAVLPKTQVLPVFGGYPDAPWDGSIQKLPPNEVYMYRFGSRVSGSMGMMGATAAAASPAKNAYDTPFITAEMGGGIQDTYHRRPVIEPDDIAAMIPVMLGSGVNLYGSYMFQGGENPDGKFTTLQESQATGYPNDLPVKSYDFQAPLGAFGRERAVLRKMKAFNYFMNDFGGLLAPMQSYAPTRVPSGPADFSVPRVSVRTDGRGGFVFINNYVRGYSMPARPGTQITVKLSGSTIKIPATPIDIPASTYFIWPFNLDLGVASLRYSTAQLFTRLRNGAEETWFFEEIPGIRTEFVLEKTAGLVVTAPGAIIHSTADTISISSIHAGFETPISLRLASGASMKIVLLTQQEVENSWKAVIDGRQSLLATAQDYFADSQQIYLRSEGAPQSAFSVYPATDHVDAVAPAKLTARPHNGISIYHATQPEKHMALEVRPIHESESVPPVKIGAAPSWRSNGVARAPGEDAFQAAARWQISVPTDFLSGVSNVFLTVDYTGDVGRLSAGGHLLDDDFYNGLPWSIGLKRFAGLIRQAPLELSILPLRKDAPVYLESKYRPDFGSQSQKVQLKKVSAIPEYEFVFTTGQK